MHNNILLHKINSTFFATNESFNKNFSNDKIFDLTHKVLTLIQHHLYCSDYVLLHYTIFVIMHLHVCVPSMPYFGDYLYQRIVLIKSILFNTCIYKIYHNKALHFIKHFMITTNFYVVCFNNLRNYYLLILHKESDAEPAPNDNKRY